MNANSKTNNANTKAGRDEMIALAREIRKEFAKIHSCMAQILVRGDMKKAA